MACGEAKLRSQRKRWANACYKAVLAYLEKHGLALFAEGEVRGFQAQQELSIVRLGDSLRKIGPEGDKAAREAITAILADYEKRHPGWAFRIVPVVTVKLHEGRAQVQSAWEISVTEAAPEQDSPTSRDALEEVWCAAKHALGLEGHLQEMMSNAAARGDDQVALRYARWLGQTVNMRRDLQAIGMGADPAPAHQGGCSRCREDMHGRR